MGGGGMGGIPIGILGMGGVARHAVRLLLDHRRGFDIVGAAAADPEVVGRRISDVAGTITPSDITVTDNLDEVLAKQPQLVIDASRSFIADVTDDVIRCIKAGANVISCCEELAFPFHRHTEYAARIDAAARAAGVTVLGTGVNPGAIFDSLVLLGTGLSWDVASIKGRRVVDVSGFSQAIHRRLGIGYTAEEFDQGHRDGSIAGHVGFPESIEIAAEGLGLQLDGPVQESFTPYIAETSAPTLYGEVPSGHTEGFSQIATATVHGHELVRLELLLHLRPTAAGYPPGDSLAIEGLHPVRISLEPGMDALLATSAHLVNSAPAVLAAPPGLKSVKDLPVAAAWLGGLDLPTLR